MANNSKAKDWIDTAEDYFPQGEESEYAFVVFLIGKNDDSLYARLKKHSICRNGYVSQVVKVNSLKKKCFKCLF